MMAIMSAPRPQGDVLSAFGADQGAPRALSAEEIESVSGGLGPLLGFIVAKGVAATAAAVGTGIAKAVAAIVD